MHGATLLLLPLTLKNYISLSLEEVTTLKAVMYQYLMSLLWHAKRKPGVMVATCYCNSQEIEAEG